MTPLPQRMIEDIQLRGLSGRTQEMDVRAVRQLAEHYPKSPARLTEEERRDSFLSLKNVKHSSRSASTIALGGITCFYEPTLTRAWPPLTFVRAPREKQLPVILRGDEVRTILVHGTLPRYRVCLRPIYACGLRLQEGTPDQFPTLTLPACACTCVAAQAPRTALCHCRHAPWSSCVSPGKRTALPWGSSPLQAVAVSACPRQPPHATLQGAGGLQGGPQVQWYQQACLGAHPATQLGDAFARGRCQAAPHAGLLGTHHANHHRPLHPSHGHKADAMARHALTERMSDL